MQSFRIQQRQILKKPSTYPLQSKVNFPPICYNLNNRYNLIKQFGSTNGSATQTIWNFLFACISRHLALPSSRRT